MNIPRIRFPIPVFRRPSRRMLALITLIAALLIALPAAWFFILPQLGIIPKDLEMQEKSTAALTTHTANTGTILSAPVAQPLVADFSAALVHPDDTATLQFLDLSRGIPGEWYWDFGDGTNAIGRFPVHRFSTRTDNPVTLTVTRGDGAKSISIRNDLLSAASLEQAAILLDTNRIATVSKGSSVSFRVNDSAGSITVGGSSIKLPYGALVKLRLNRDSEGSVAVRNGQLLAAIFPDATLFIDGKQAARGPVTQVTTNNPAWLSTDLSLTVLPVSGDIRQFIVNGSSIQAGQHNANILIRQFALYPRSGLTLETNPAYFAGDAVAYRLRPDVIAEFDPADPVTGNVPFNITFSDRSAGSPQVWVWDFGDGTTGSEQNPKHTYRNPGSYTVSLTAGNEEVTDMEKKNQLVIATLPRIEADFSADPVTGPSPLEVRFTDQSTGSPTSWYWDFGDNTSSVSFAEKNPVHTYDKKGVYSVMLGVGNIFGSSELYRRQYIVVSDPFEPAENAVFLRAARGGYIEPGSTFQFSVAGSPATISTGGITHDLPYGAKVRLVVTTPQYGSITTTGGKLVRFDLDDVAVYINDRYIRTGRIDSIYIPGMDTFRTSLSYYMPPGSAWMLYTENGYDVLADLEDRWIRVNNIGMNENGLLSLIATENSTYIDGAAYRTEHDWIVE